MTRTATLFPCTTLCLSLSILAVVERGVEHGGVELVVRERRLPKAGLEAWEQRWQVRAVVTGSAHSVAVVGEQVDRARPIARKRPPVTHPAVACTQVQDHGPGTVTPSNRKSTSPNPSH